MGIELVNCQSVKSVVLRDVASPPVWIPTATQVVRVAQEIEVKALMLGLTRTDHGSLFVVPITAGPPFTTPMAAHVTWFEHETMDNESVLDGEDCVVQVDPSVVSLI